MGSRFRTVIRFEEIGQKICAFVVPGWNSRRIVGIETKLIPGFILRHVQQGNIRVHAKVDLAAEYADQLLPEWECPTCGGSKIIYFCDQAQTCHECDEEQN